MKKLTIATSLCLLTVFLQGCASIMCGPTQTISIRTKPDGAEVVVYDIFGSPLSKQRTPCAVTLDRSTADYESARYKMTITKEGFAPVEIELIGQVNRAYFANLLFGPLGLIIDPITGSMWTLSPYDIDTVLVSSQAAFFGKEKGLYVCLKEQVPQELLPYLKPAKLAN